MELWEVINTPLNIMRQESEYHVIMGKYRLSGTFDNLEDAIKDAERMDLNRLSQIMGIVAKIELNDKEYTEKLN